MNRRLPLVSFFCFVSFVLRAQVPFDVSYYHHIRLEKVNNLTALKFTPLDDLHHLNAFDNEGIYLFKIHIHKPHPANNIIVSILDEHLDTVSLYKQLGETLAFVEYAGNNFYAVQTHLGPPSFRLNGTDSVLFIKVKFKKNVIFPIQINTVATNNKYNLYLLFELGLYHGVVIIVFLINLLLFFVFKDKRFIYYNGFLFFLALSFLYSNSHFPIFTQTPFWLNNSDLLLHLGITITGALFGTNFLEIEHGYPWAKWITSFCMAFIIVAFVVNIYHSNFYFFLLGEVATFLNLVMFWIISVLRIKEHPFAKYFALAYGVLIFFMLNYYIFRQLGFGLNLFTGQLEVANMFEMLVLSVALSFSVDRLKRDNQRYRQEIDHYMQGQVDLQRKVGEQTNVVVEISQVYATVQEKYRLTERETEVLKGIAAGLTNQEIADKLFLSVNTIKFHTRKLFEKLEISNRAQAASRFHESA